jgi:hypothetical protein
VLLGYIIRNLVARAKNSHFAALFHPKGDKHESVFLLAEIPRLPRDQLQPVPSGGLNRIQSDPAFMGTREGYEAAIKGLLVRAEKRIE